MIRVVTTTSKKGYEEYGHRLLRTFDRFWPRDIKLYFYSEDIPSADLPAVERVASRLATAVEESPPGFILLRKTGPTPERFPRRPGVAKKRPLA